MPPRTSRRKSTPLSPARPPQNTTASPRHGRHSHRIASREVEDKPRQVTAAAARILPSTHEEGDTIEVNSPQRSDRAQLQPASEDASQVEVSESSDGEEEKEEALDRETIIENLPELNKHANKLLSLLDQEKPSRTIAEINGSSSKLSKTFKLTRQQFLLDLTHLDMQNARILPIERINSFLDPHDIVPELEALLVRVNLALFATSLSHQGLQATADSAKLLLHLSQSTNFPRSWLTAREIEGIQNAEFWSDTAGLVVNLPTQAFIEGIALDLDGTDLDAERELEIAFKNWREQFRQLNMYESAKAEKLVMSRYSDLRKFVSRGAGPQVDILGLRQKYSYKTFVIDAIDWCVARNKVLASQLVNVGTMVAKLEGSQKSPLEETIDVPAQKRKSGGDGFEYNRKRDEEASEDEEDSEDELESQYRSQSRVPHVAAGSGFVSMAPIAEDDEVELEPTVRSERQPSVELPLAKPSTRARPADQHSEAALATVEAHGNLHESIEHSQEEGVPSDVPETQQNEPSYVVNPSQAGLQVLRHAIDHRTVEGTPNGRRYRLTDRQPGAQAVRWDDTQDNTDDNIGDKRRHDETEDSEDEFETITRPNKRPRSGKAPSSSAPAPQRHVSTLFIPAGSEEPAEDLLPTRPTSSAPQRAQKPSSSHGESSRRRDREIESNPPASSIEQYKEARREHQANRRDAALLVGMNRANTSRPMKPHQVRVGWSEDEMTRLMELMAEFADSGVHCNWSGMMKADAEMDDPQLQGRDQVGLKDKARNMKFDFLAGLRALPPGFEHVTLKKTDIQKLQARGAPVPDWDLERHGREV